MKVKVYSTSKHPLPQYATKQSAGLDLRANIDAPITINPRERVLVPTGLHIQLPDAQHLHQHGVVGDQSLFELFA